MKVSSLALLLLSVCCCAFLPTRAAWAQDAAEPSAWPSARFEQWAKEVDARTVKRLGKPEATEIEPELLSAKGILLERLRQEKWTTDSAILSIVRAWAEYESPRPNQDGKRDAQGQLFPITIAGIDQLVPLLQDRPLVLSRLYSMKGTFLSSDRKDAQAAEAFGKAVSVVAPLALESELLQLNNLVEQASLTSETDEEKADALYRDVLRTPRLFINDEETKRRVRILQVRAGRAIIALHSGDAKALYGLYSITANIAELKPELDAAMEEARLAQTERK